MVSLSGKLRNRKFSSNRHGLDEKNAHSNVQSTSKKKPTKRSSQKGWEDDFLIGFWCRVIFWEGISFGFPCSKIYISHLIHKSTNREKIEAQSVSKPSSVTWRQALVGPPSHIKREPAMLHIWLRFSLS